jgi:1-acyl-sn-glycerol-3-phosphate acyltransferase
MVDPNGYRVRPANRFWRGILRFIGRRLLFAAFSHPIVSGTENIPPHSGYIIAFNHLSIFDPPFLVCHWPYPPEWIGAAEMFHERDKKLLVTMYGGIPLDRDNLDRRALRNAEIVLKCGYPLMIAPEMRITRQPGLRRAHTGISYLAQQTGAPVLPVGITGTGANFLSEVKKLKKPTVKMKIGRLIFLPGVGDNRKVEMQRNADIVMANIARLLPEEYRGYYEDFESFLGNER